MLSWKTLAESSLKKRKVEMPKKLEYDVELDDLNIDLNDAERDNVVALERSIKKIQVIVRDIEKRLEALE